MKHIKSISTFENISYRNKIVKSLLLFEGINIKEVDPEVIETCNDILIDLKDDFYEVKVRTDLVFYRRAYDIIIEIKKPGRFQKVAGQQKIGKELLQFMQVGPGNTFSDRFIKFKKSDMNNIIERLDNYLQSEGYRRLIISGYSDSAKKIYTHLTIKYRKY